MGRLPESDRGNLDHSSQIQSVFHQWSSPDKGESTQSSIDQYRSHCGSNRPLVGVHQSTQEVNVSIVDIGHSVLILALAGGTGLGSFLYVSTDKCRRLGERLMVVCFVAGWVTTAIFVANHPEIRLGPGLARAIVSIIAGGGFLFLMPLFICCIPFAIAISAKAWVYSEERHSW